MAPLFKLISIGSLDCTFQVLVSIQGFVFCPEPYYNEPSYHKFYGDPLYKAPSLATNEAIFRSNLNWAIIDQIRAPSEGFEDVRPIFVPLVRSNF